MTIAEDQRLENPLLEGLQLTRRPEPCAMVIFGASGDLTKRKLFPALYSLAYRQLLPEKFGIVGVARTERRVGRLVGGKAVGSRLGGGEEANHASENNLRGGGTLPDPPLPGQGPRQKLAGAGVGEGVLRADREPPVRRSHPDHGRGDD